MPEQFTEFAVGARGQSDRGGPADVVYVLCLMQAAFLVLAALGEVLLMGGNPAYLVLPMVKVLLLLVVAAKVVKGRRWAMITMIVIQGITLVGFWLQVIAGILPWVDYTVNLVGLLTNLAMPAGIVYLCTVLIARISHQRITPPPLVHYPVPVDPYYPVFVDPVTVDYGVPR
jgi:hypothetical protein